jgi:hypothetical protein
MARFPPGLIHCVLPGQARSAKSPMRSPRTLGRAISGSGRITGIPEVSGRNVRIADIPGEINDYCFSCSQKLSGLTKITTCPGIGVAVAFPHVFGITMPSAIIFFVEKRVVASQL